MILYAAIALGVVLLLGGIIFVIRGMREQTEKIVPISDLQELKPYHKPVDVPVASRVVPASPAPVVAPQPPEKSLQTKYDELSRENQRLNEALAREVASKEIKTLSEKEHQELKENERQLFLIQQSVEEITKENHKITNHLKEEKDKVSQLEQAVKDLTNEKNIIESTANIKMNELKVEVDDLKKENEELKIHRVSLDKMRTDYQSVLTSKKSLEENLKTVERVQQEKIAEVKENYHALSLQQQESIQKQIEVIGGKLSEALGTMAKLKKEREALIKMQEQLVVELEKTKELNSHLMDKERKSQYELTKSRAHSLGLEKICEDFKLQIEEMSKSLANQKI